jgi:predicted enzyme related to lactoylglutathione lyase
MERDANGVGWNAQTMRVGDCVDIEPATLSNPAVKSLRTLFIVMFATPAYFAIGALTTQPADDQSPHPATQPVEFRSAIPNMLVGDIPAAVKFYTEKLGFTESSSGPNYAVMQRGQVTIGLIGSKAAAGKSWCYITVSDPKTLYKDYQSAGVKVLQPLQSWGDHTEFTIADAEGNRMDIGN